MDIVVYTDCTKYKLDAIVGVFTAKFGPPTTQHIESSDIEAPLRRSDFFAAARKRIEWIKRNSVNKKSGHFFATIQRGFFKEHDHWHLLGFVMIQDDEGDLLSAYTSSVPLPKHVSNQMNDNPNKRYEAMKEEYPEWNRDDVPMYEIITREKEIDWFKEALRNCMKIYKKKIPA